MATIDKHGNIHAAGTGKFSEKNHTPYEGPTLSSRNEHEVRAAMGPVLDEVWGYRVRYASELTELERILAKFKGFPKSRVRFAEKQIERFRQLASGHAELALSGVSSLSLDNANKNLGTGSHDTSWHHEEEPMRLAVREHYLLQRAAAYEAVVLRAHITNQMPKTCEQRIRASADRLEMAARGMPHEATRKLIEWERANNITPVLGATALERVGAPDLLNAQTYFDLAEARKR